MNDDLVELMADEPCAGTPAAFGKILEARERATEAFHLHKARLLGCAETPRPLEPSSMAPAGGSFMTDRGCLKRLLSAPT